MAEKQLEFEKAVRAVQASNKFRRGSFHPVSFSDGSESADSDQEKIKYTYQVHLNAFITVAASEY